MQQLRYDTELRSKIREVFSCYGKSLPDGAHATNLPERSFHTEKFLRSLAASDGTIDPEHLGILDKLARRIEVFRRLDRAYDALLRKTTLREPVDTACVGFLCALFLCAFHQMQDYRHLNTVLKINDGMLEAPIFSPPDALIDLADALVGRA